MFIITYHHYHFQPNNMSFHYNYYRNETCHKHLPWCYSWQHHELICHIQCYIGRFQPYAPICKNKHKIYMQKSYLSKCWLKTIHNSLLKFLHHFCNHDGWYNAHLIYYKINSTNSNFIVPISNHFPIFMQSLLFQQLERVFYDAHSWYLE